MITLIDAQTQAITSDGQYTYDKQGEFAIIESGLAGSEEINIQYSLDGTNYFDLYQYGYQVKLSATNNAVGVFCPVYIRVVKGVTASPVTVVLQTKIR